MRIISGFNWVGTRTLSYLDEAGVTLLLLLKVLRGLFKRPFPIRLTLEQMEEVEDSVVIGQNWKNDVRVILFVKLAPGYELTDDLKNKIKQTIRANASPRHVPAKILSTPEVPYTLNMKKVELAVKKIIEGQPVLNRDALGNPEALDYYENLPELQQD